MGMEIVSLSFLLLLLVTQGLGHDGHVHGPHGHGHGDDGHSSTSEMSMMDKSKFVFFRVNDLKVGAKMPVYLPHEDPIETLNSLPQRQADAMPFSSAALPYLLQFYSFSPYSQAAKNMETSLWLCESPPVQGEIQHCANSMESLLGFATSLLGTNSIQLLTTSTKTTSVLLQNYTIVQQPEEIKTSKMVACHTLSFPYTVYYCHYPGQDTKAFKVSLEGENGDKVEVLTVCHFDTSHWDPKHVSFSLLGVKPGTTEICHFFSPDHIVLLPKSSMQSS